MVAFIAAAAIGLALAAAYAVGRVGSAMRSGLSETEAD